MQSTNKLSGRLLDSAKGEQRIELVVEQHEAEDRVAIRYSTWTEGLGWCTQKTIRLDADQLDELHRAVTVARHRINRNCAEAGRPVSTAQVIRFPTLA